MDVEKVSLKNHLVIEASAGSGKTHTITELIRRLLFEENTSLAQILVVTYTEKATGELKGRIREMIEKEAEKSDQARKALDDFDQAAIFTIHGFCQRVLQENAFAHRQDFAGTLVDDREVARNVLREVQRRRWNENFGRKLTEQLTLCQYGEDWEKKVCKLATDFKESCGHLLLPKPPDDLGAWFEELEAKIQNVRREVQELAGLSDGDEFERHRWLAEFPGIKVNGTDRNTSVKYILRPMLTWLTDAACSTSILSPTVEFLKSARNASNFDKAGFGRLFLLRNDAGLADPGDLCKGLSEAVRILDQSLSSCKELAEARHLLAAWTTMQLQADLRQHKRDRAQQSFDDMLERLEEALRRPEAVDQLRDRFRFAIVDEFQDTDPIQWRIFQKVFAESAGGHRLFVVGDPKQSIFGFRGADVNAYDQAKEALKTDHSASEETLDYNWRSHPHLIDALNTLFENGEFFSDDPIRYTRVRPCGDQGKYKLGKDATDLEALTLLPWSDSAAGKGKSICARKIAAEIRRLLGDGRPLMTFSKSGVEKPLEAGDICILVAKRSEAKPLLEQLRAKRVPYLFYKEPGLWQSEAAEHLEIALQAIARPDQPTAFRKALLTDFFGFDARRVLDVEEAEPRHRSLLERWREVADARDWARLFHSLIHETGILHAWFGTPDGERRRANLLHISAELQQEAYREDLDLFDLLERLKSRRQDDRSQDIDLQPIETDRSKVRIMTIHASKGLEYPIVFLAGGFTTGGTSSYLSYRRGKRRVFDLRSDDEDARAGHHEEQIREWRRLYYVALTRAIFKLYVPLAHDRKSTHYDGPLITLVNEAIRKAGMESGECQHVSVGLPSSEMMASAEAEAPSPRPQTVKSDAKPLLVEALPNDLDQLRFRRARLESFTSLNRRLEAARPHYLAETPREDDEPEEPVEAPDPFRGMVFGDMLHDFLEIVDWSAAVETRSAESFATLAEAALETVCQRHWARFPAAVADNPDGPAECRRRVANLAWRALTTPLPTIGRLCDVPTADRLHEVEFQFPESEAPDQPAPNNEDRFFRGYMDLVFRKDGRYFLLDWKSNWLPDGYGEAALEQAMQDSGYHRQYRLYLVALCRWLKLRQRGFSLKKHVGGVFYLFVRGMTGGDDSPGVYFHEATARDLNLKSICST